MRALPVLDRLGLLPDRRTASWPCPRLPLGYDRHRGDHRPLDKGRPGRPSSVHIGERRDRDRRSLSLLVERRDHVGHHLREPSGPGRPLQRVASAKETKAHRLRSERSPRHGWLSARE